MNKSQAINTQTENRWVPLKLFCERTNMKIRTARFYMSTGKLKIKPKDKKMVVFLSIGTLGTINENSRIAKFFLRIVK